MNVGLDFSFPFNILLIHSSVPGAVCNKHVKDVFMQCFYCKKKMLSSHILIVSRNQSEVSELL